MTDLFLADCSRYQGVVDWVAYSKWSRAAICKATQGTSGVDERFFTNRSWMRQHLVVRGYYHFLTDQDVVKQAGHFADVVGELLPGEFAVLDVEQNADHARHERFCARVDDLIGGVTWLYGGQQVRSSRPVWVARYPRGQYPDADARWRPGQPAPAGEPSIPHVLWQFTDYGDSVPGITGNCDLNVHRGDLASLARLTVQPEEDDVALTDADVSRIASMTRDFVRTDLYRLAQFLAGESNATFDAARVGAPPPTGGAGATAAQIVEELARRLA